MNEIEFEQVARQATANLRLDAEQSTDSRAALAQLLAREETHREQRKPAAVKVDNARLRRRSPWIPILIAASTIVAVGGIVLFATRDGEQSLVVTTEPPQPEQPGEPSGEPDATMPDVNDPEPTAPQVPTTAPEAVDEGSISPFVFDVPEDIGPPLLRTELLTADIGSGELELGWDDCQECEQLRPWAPVVDDQGTIYIADVVNERWRVVREGVSTNIPFPDGELVAGSPVIGPDGYLYAVVAAELAPVSPRRVVAYDPTTLEERYSYPIGPSIFDQLLLHNGQIELGGAVVATFGMLLGTPTVDIDNNIVTISLSGTQREFHFPDGWSIGGRDAFPIDDGSVVVRALAPSAAAGELVLVRLWLDGTASSGTIANDSSTNSAVQITADGLVQMEGTTVVRYELPEFGGNDPLAKWVVPEFDDPDVARVPRLLPQLSISDEVSSIRSEGADANTQTPYSQTWVRPDESDDVDAVVEIRTSFDPQPIWSADDGEVVIPGWPMAYFAVSGPDVAILQLHSASRSMAVWATGLTRADVLAIATSLQVDADGAGWATPDLPRPDRWVLVHQGWSAGAASRTFEQQDSDGTTQLEMWTVAGAPEAIGTPGLLWNRIALRSIDGRPALLFDRGWGSAVTWSPRDDLVVVLGSYGPLDELFEIARSVVEVDQPTWEAASTIDISTNDGCSSMFC